MTRAPLFALIAALVLLYGLPASAQSNLPASVQADLVKRAIFDALDKRLYKAALVQIDQYRRLMPQGYPPLIDMLDARASLEAGRPGRAKAALEAYLRRSPSSDPYYQDALALYPRIKTAVAAEQAALNAEATATRAFRESVCPDRVTCLYYGLTSQKLSPQTILTRADLLLKRWPKNPYALGAKAEGLARAKRFAEAAAAYSLAIRSTQDTWYLARYHQSRAYFLTSLPPSVRLEDLLRYLGYKPMFDVAEGYFPLIKSVPGGFEKITAAYGNAYQSSSTSERDKAWILGSRLRFYEDFGRYDLAIQDATTLIAAKPNDPWFWMKRCELRVYANVDLRSALDDCNAAIGREKDRSMRSRIVRGLAQLRLDDFASAQVSFNEAEAALLPNEIVPHEWLAQMYYGRGVAKLKLGDKAGGNAEIMRAIREDAETVKSMAAMGIRT